ncbi:MAG: glycosyltransferase family 2 protein [Chthoniobacterales bacterium]
MNTPDEQTIHLTPDGHDVGGEELSVVVPAMNEELTVGEFVDWCKQGLADAGVRGQILIVDSSSDNTPEIALKHGAEVLRTPPRGLGRAYIDAIPFIRGQWIVMGDADLTYDFRELAPFVAQFRKGAEFVMGSRFRGSIEPGSMPGLHRYFGTPFTTWLLNRIYHSRYSDIHCGMRGLTRSALEKIDLKSQSWEYASEMVLKAARFQLVTAEVPVKFYKDRAGRVSHHKRMGWLSPWIAGWLNLKAMLVYTPDSFLLKPGMVAMALGMILSLTLAHGPIQIGPVVFSLYWMLLGVTLTTLGYSCLQIGILSRMMHGLRPKLVRRFETFFTYDRGMLISGLCCLAGVLLAAVLVWRYVRHGLRLESLSYSAILGLLLIIVGFQTFCFTLLIEMAKRVMPRASKANPGGARP